jgi:hypothetical protein
MVSQKMFQNEIFTKPLYSIAALCLIRFFLCNYTATGAFIAGWLT